MSPATILLGGLNVRFPFAPTRPQVDPILLEYFPKPRFAHKQYMTFQDTDDGIRYLPLLLSSQCIIIHLRVISLLSLWRYIFHLLVCLSFRTQWVPQVYSSSKHCHWYKCKILIKAPPLLLEVEFGVVTFLRGSGGGLPG